MVVEKELRVRSNERPDPSSRYLQKFRLFETRSYFYMVGRDKNRTIWKVLKIDRSEPSKLNIVEDSTTYSEHECGDLLKRIHEGNKSTGGLNFVTTCYGIVGFIKFLGPYYMLLIKKRRKIGAICGHNIFAITRIEMIPVPNATVRSNMSYSKNENRYKKLLCTVDLTKDFFFSYSYNVMHSLQKNLCSNERGHYETMFVWNEFSTREIRKIVKNSLWTVALVYGFFKQSKLSVTGRDFSLTLIARRSRRYAGTRYLKRGVNKRGRVANDVETEQIVIEDAPEGCPVQISSVVQNRGSIPLFWSQETSRLNIRPDIILSKKDPNYDATRLHFQNLASRYGNPIIVLNLIKTREKKPHESILRKEFAKAINAINKDVPEESHLIYLHWDLKKHSRNKSINVLALLGEVVDYALHLTGIFYYELTSNSRLQGLLNASLIKENQGFNCSSQNLSDINEGADNLTLKDAKNNCEKISNNGEERKIHGVRNPMLQKGALRTNCIDCLDRTNIAQYAYGLAALGRQLHALGFLDSSNINLDDPLAEDLMKVYESMGDTLALQYGGSAAHNKIFCERRGQWRAATHSQEFFRNIQRYCNNAYMDAEKQDAINVFLGHFQPQQGKPALWELGSDQLHKIGSSGTSYSNEDDRSLLKRSLSDGTIRFESDLSLTERVRGGRNNISEFTPEIPIFETNVSYSRYIPSRQELVRHAEGDHICCYEHGKTCSCLDFIEVDQLSSSGNSCEDPQERILAGPPSASANSEI